MTRSTGFDSGGHSAVTRAVSSNALLYVLSRLSPDVFAVVSLSCSLIRLEVPITVLTSSEAVTDAFVFNPD